MIFELIIWVELRLKLFH